MSFIHEGLFYRDDATYVAGTLPFIYAAVSADEPCMVAAPPSRVALLQQRLGGFGEGVRFHDMTTAGRNPARIIPWVLTRFADEHAGRPVRIIGEPIWAGRSTEEYAVCVQHEAMINVAFRARPGTILCPYDTSRLSPEVLADAEQTHPIVVEDGARSASRRYDPHHVVRTYNRAPAEPPPGATATYFEATDLGSVRNLLADRGKIAGLGAERIDDVVQAVHELAANSVAHGGGSGTLRTWLLPDRLVCEVRDFGLLTDPLAGRLRPAPTSEHGRGLVIVHYLADLVQTFTCSTGTTIRAHFLR
jgi:anti-sigma regulatory factor (Ser/Thr protein kinase)